MTDPSESAATQPCAGGADPAPLMGAPFAALRAENVGVEPLSDEQLDAAFAAQQTTLQPAPHGGGPGVRYQKAPTGAPGPAWGATRVMEDSDLDHLLRTLDNQETPWSLPWAGGPPAPPPREYRTVYTADDVYAPPDGLESEEGELAEIRQIVRDLETATASIDDTTVELRENTQRILRKVDDVGACIAAVQAQNAALVEEVRELRHEVATMRNQMAALFRHLLAHLGPSGEPGPRSADAASAEKPAKAHVDAKPNPK